MKIIRSSASLGENSRLASLEPWVAMFCIEMHWKRLMMAAAMNFATFPQPPQFLFSLPVQILESVYVMNKFCSRAFTWLSTGVM